MSIYKQSVAEAAIKAGKAILDIYDTDFDITIKDDSSPLTTADREANTIIMRYLEPTGIPIISEENKAISYEERKQWTSCWIVDPLDGTKEFINKNGEFTVNIALVEAGKPIMGVIYVPVSKTLYIGDVKQGVSKKYNTEDSGFSLALLDETGETLASAKESENHIRIVGSRSHMSTETQEYIDQFKAQGKEVISVSRGSSLKFCMIAEGLADKYPRFAPTMEWDTAAGQAICEAVDVQVFSKETNAPLLYNKENLLNPWFLVNP